MHTMKTVKESTVRINWIEGKITCCRLYSSSSFACSVEESRAAPAAGQAPSMGAAYQPASSLSSSSTGCGRLLLLCKGEGADLGLEGSSGASALGREGLANSGCTGTGPECSPMHAELIIC